jgi:hypothetical protein
LFFTSDSRAQLRSRQQDILKALLGRRVVSAGTNLEWRNANANEHDVHEFKRVEDQWAIGDELFRNAAVARD